MTKFDLYIEQMEKRRQEESERKLDEWLYQSVRARKKSEVLRDLENGLFFRVKKSRFKAKRGGVFLKGVAKYLTTACKSCKL